MSHNNNINDLVPKMNQFFENLVSPVFGRDAYNQWLTTLPSQSDLNNLRHWNMSPKYNLVERENHFEYNFDVPGVKKEDVFIEERDCVLIVKGNRHTEKHDEKDGYSYRETHHGEFSRSVKLDDRCNLDDMKAELVDGVLCVRVGKTEPEAAGNVRKIHIH